MVPSYLCLIYAANKLRIYWLNSFKIFEKISGSGNFVTANSPNYTTLFPFLADESHTFALIIIWILCLQFHQSDSVARYEYATMKSSKLYSVQLLFPLSFNIKKYQIIDRKILCMYLWLLKQFFAHFDICFRQWHGIMLELIVSPLAWTLPP